MDGRTAERAIRAVSCDALRLNGHPVVAQRLDCHPEVAQRPRRIWPRASGPVRFVERSRTFAARSLRPPAAREPAAARLALDDNANRLLDMTTSAVARAR